MSTSLRVFTYQVLTIQPAESKSQARPARPVRPSPKTHQPARKRAIVAFAGQLLIDRWRCKTRRPILCLKGAFGRLKREKEMFKFHTD
jgi:hypothetical protein